MDKRELKKHIYNKYDKIHNFKDYSITEKICINLTDYIYNTIIDNFNIKNIYNVNIESNACTDTDQNLIINHNIKIFFRIGLKADINIKHKIQKEYYKAI